MVSKKTKKTVKKKTVDRSSLSKKLSDLTKSFTKKVTDLAEEAGVIIGVKVLIAESKKPAIKGEKDGGN